MHQAWHIFKKDVRFLYREIAFLLALAVLFGWLDRAAAGLGADASDALELLYVAAVAYTVARLVHAEAIPGENQFWVTRPYRWRSLFAAKTMFLIVFVQLPVLIVQTVILLVDGFPLAAIFTGLLWTQVLIVLAISLPCFAIAALTAGMVAFIATLLVLLVIGFVTVESSFRSVILSPESIDWVRHSIPLIAAAVSLPPVLYIQYRYRRTRFADILAASVALCAAALFVLVPGPALFAVQTLVSRQSFPVAIARDTSQPFDPRLDSVGRIVLSLPLLISGVPAGVRPQVEMYDLRLQRADGHALPLSVIRLGLHRGDGNSHALLLSGLLYPDRWFLEGARGQPVTLRLSLYLTLYGNTREKTIPFQTIPVNALDGLRCFDGYFDEVVCRAPFRWPGRIVSVKSPWGGLTPFTRLVSYSPFPANLQLAPVVERSAGPHWSQDRQSARQVTIEIEEPLAYLRRDVQVPNLSLGAR